MLLSITYAFSYIYLSHIYTGLIAGNNFGDDLQEDGIAATTTDYNNYYTQEEGAEKEDVDYTGKHSY